jgi:hypothetical protein
VRLRLSPQLVIVPGLKHLATHAGDSLHPRRTVHSPILDAYRSVSLSVTPRPGRARRRLRWGACGGVLVAQASVSVRVSPARPAMPMQKGRLTTDRHTSWRARAKRFRALAYAASRPVASGIDAVSLSISRMKIDCGSLGRDPGGGILGGLGC